MMKRLIQLLSLSILLSAPIAPAGGVTVDVFLLGGQSNAGGRGAVSELPDSSVVYNTEIMLFHSASMVSGQTAGSWTTLRPASNSAGYFGPEIGFGNRMAELYPGRQIAIIKHAVGATDLGSNWNPGADTRDTANFGPQFRIFVETVDSGIDSLIAQGYTPVIRGMLWQQGERDSRNSSYGPAYDKNLSHFIGRVRAQFNALGLPFIYGQVLPVPLSGYNYRDQVRQGQFNIDEDSGHEYATDGARLVLADDLPMNSDNLHISAAGQFELGIRFADALATVVAANTVDFNADGKVDKADVSALIDYWHQDEPAYDVAPPPFGDGIVDVEDLVVVAEHLFMNISDPSLMAHWTFDESEGATAQDSAGGNDGFVIGGASWRPADGMIDGALELDGVDDFVSTPAILNPADGPFSVFAWIKGGGPGQAIVAQQVTSDWLSLDAEGRLMTNIKYMGRSGAFLVSETVIDDEQWHRVGLVWDGSQRTLVIDGTAAAKDMPAALATSDRGLCIGADKDFSVESLFSGLIDDVRIYGRAIKSY